MSLTTTASNVISTLSNSSSTTPQVNQVNYLPSIKCSQKIYKYVQIIDSEIDKLYNLTSYKLNPSLTHAVCNLVEYLIGKNKYNIDKKKFVSDYLTQKFNLSASETAEIEKQIDFIIELGAVSNISLIKKICLYIKSKFLN